MEKRCKLPVYPYYGIIYPLYAIHKTPLQVLFLACFSHKIPALCLLFDAFFDAFFILNPARFDPKLLKAFKNPLHTITSHYTSLKAWSILECFGALWTKELLQGEDLPVPGPLDPRCPDHVLAPIALFTHIVPLLAITFH